MIKKAMEESKEEEKKQQDKPSEEDENKKQEEAFLKDMEKMKGVADSMVDVAFNITLFDI